LKEGKRTLLILKALEKCSPEEKEKIESALGNQGLSPEHAEEVRAIIRETGSLDHSRKLASDLIGQAKQAVSQSGFREEAKSFLLGIADYMLKRDY